MSLITEILDRLTGLSAIKVQLDTTASEVRKIGDWVLDLEKRMIRLESHAVVTPPTLSKPPRLPRK
jgi:hypothetical protein